MIASNITHNASANSLGLNRGLVGSLLKSGNCLTSLLAKLFIVANEVDEIRDLEVKKHTSDLASPLSVDLGDLGVQLVAKDLLLVVDGHSGERFLSDWHFAHKLALLNGFGRLIATASLATTMTTTSAVVPGTTLARTHLTGHGALGAGELLATRELHNLGVVEEHLGLTACSLLHTLGSIEEGGTAGRHTGGKRGTTHGSILGLKMSTAYLTGLVKGNVKGLVGKDGVVHGSDSTSSLIGRAVADKAKALALSLLVLHDTSRGNGTELSKALTKLVIINRLIQVLDVKVHTSPLSLLVKAALFPLSTELSLSLGLFLGLGDDHLLTKSSNTLLAVTLLVFFLAHLLKHLLGNLRIFKVDETKTTARTTFISHHNSADHLTVLGEEFLELFGSDFKAKVLDVKVGEFLGATLLPLSAGNEVGHGHLLAVDEHIVHLLNSRVGLLELLELDEAISLGGTALVHGNLKKQFPTHKSTQRRL
mmetsp:Transcript_21176/g.55061  ORF Transcript_21176/g.55061 Transcript_21176/m.55061 type:complete len:479 (-) Transcript_21176:691-2127(-)